MCGGVFEVGLMCGVGCVWRGVWGGDVWTDVWGGLCVEGCVGWGCVWRDAVVVIAVR